MRPFTNRTLAIAAAAFSFALPGLAAAPANAEEALFAGGCFWCLEADMDHVRGVSETISGYAGGETSYPTYHTYASGGHREVVKITFDPTVISYRDLVDTFLHSVDVTDDGGQFCDRGHAYTTAIYALNDSQKASAEKVKAEDQKALGQTIVTPVEGAAKFWPAEDYHQGYYKSQERMLTRFGYVTRAQAYKGYRKGCGRDETVRSVWGSAAYKGIPTHQGS